MKNPLVSIIIVTYNSREYIEDCLRSVLDNSYPNFEVLVFDNNSSDKTIKLVREVFNLTKHNSVSHKIIKSKKNLGFALGNNLAIRRARGKYVFILNPDTLVEKDFLKFLVTRAQSNPKIVACQPLIYLFDGKIINLTGKITHFLGFDWLRDFKLKMSKQTKKDLSPGQIYSFSGAGILLKKEIFKKIGGFDNKYFMYYEDSDLSWRLNLFDYKIYFEPKSVLYHDYRYLPRENIQPLKQKLFYIERNRLITIFKNYSKRSLGLILPSLIFMESGMIAFAFYEGWGMEKLKTYLSIFRLRKHILRQREFIQTRRVVGDREIIKNFESEITFEKFNNPMVKNIVNPILKFNFKIMTALL